VTESTKLDITIPKTLVVGLGNPGDDYARHRHNIGFCVVEALARQYGLAFTRQKSVKARVAQGQIRGHEVLLAKPLTFMNLSGKSVSRMSRAHEIPPERILVVYDDLDLPLGRLRLRPQGGSGGHRGMRSIIDFLGTQAFPRLRVGIDRPPGRMDPAEYVLRPFGEEQELLVSDAVAQAAAAVESWLEGGIVAAMDLFNRPPMEQPARDAASDVESECQEDRD
jgi:PTH1 family peptidyl-tRNA hydrolase